MDLSAQYDRNEKLTFEDLKIGDRFIAFPLPGDNSGHGGYKGAHWIFMKIEIVGELSPRYRSVRLCTGSLLKMDDSMPVIKVE